MPGASSMRGVTGFRVVDAVNGALAQLLPDRVPAAGEGGNTLAIFGAERPEGGRFIFYELVVGTWGGTPEADGNDGLTNPASLAANIPVEVAESGVPDRGRAVRARARLGRRRPPPRRARGRARLALPHARHVADRPLRPSRRTRPTASRAAVPARSSENVLAAPGRQRGDAAADVLDRDRRGDVYEHRTAGGGGWGDPRERDPAAVADDVLNEKVSRGGGAGGSTGRQVEIREVRR